MPLCSECQAYAIDAIFYFDGELSLQVQSLRKE